MVISVMSGIITAPATKATMGDERSTWAKIAHAPQEVLGEFVLGLIVAHAREDGRDVLLELAPLPDLLGHLEPQADVRVRPPVRAGRPAALRRRLAGVPVGVGPVGVKREIHQSALRVHARVERRIVTECMAAHPIDVVVAIGRDRGLGLDGLGVGAQIAAARGNEALVVEALDLVAQRQVGDRGDVGHVLDHAQVLHAAVHAGAHG